MRWGSYVALGDSFTEGLDDPYPDGGAFRGWADLVAAALARARNDFGYANLAIRGRLLRPIVDEQVPVALTAGAELVSFAAGINDALRRGFDSVSLATRFDATVARLRGSGADVVLFRFADGIDHLPGRQVIGRRIAVLNRAVVEAADRHGAIVVDLAIDDEFANPALWSPDRLHLAATGHRRVAAHVLTALGVDPDSAWWDAPSRPPRRRWHAALAADLVWAGRHAAPWIKRRLTGRSSGDGITAKRPTLGPIISITE